MIKREVFCISSIFIECKLYLYENAIISDIINNNINMFLSIYFIYKYVIYILCSLFRVNLNIQIYIKLNQN